MTFDSFIFVLLAPFLYLLAFILGKTELILHSMGISLFDLNNLQLLPIIILLLIITNATLISIIYSLLKLESLTKKIFHAYQVRRLVKQFFKQSQLGKLYTK